MVVMKVDLLGAMKDQLKVDSMAERTVALLAENLERMMVVRSVEG